MKKMYAKKSFVENLISKNRNGFKFSWSSEVSKKTFRCVLLENAFFPKMYAKKSFPLSAVWREKSSHVGKRSYADWIGFCVISASLTLCIDSAQQLDKGKRDPRTKNRKRQHLHCVSLETAALALRLVGFSVLHWKAKQPASKEKQKLWRVNMCTR